MLTGDALEVAREIGRDVGLLNIQRVADLKAPAAGNGTDVFGAVDGFAEVFPEDKFTVVSRLQTAGHVTGMTGDGVNDAPALREAEVGIAVNTATDVAKAAASIVLTEPGLVNIVDLVEQGRTIYQRILTWIINKISRTILKASFRRHCLCHHRQICGFRFRDAAPGLHDRFCQNRLVQRPCAPLQKT